MSISSVSNNSYAPPVLPQSVLDSLSNYAGVAAGGNAAAKPAAKAASGSGSSASPFEALASDIQAMLIQAQGGNAASASGGSSTTTAAASPEQTLAKDLQSLLEQMRKAEDAGKTGGAHPHHAPDSSDSITAAHSSSDPTPSDSGQVSRALAADIMQALKAYGASQPASQPASASTTSVSS